MTYHPDISFYNSANIHYTRNKIKTKIYESRHLNLTEEAKCKFIIHIVRGEKINKFSVFQN